MKNKPLILIIDDDEAVCTSLSLLLERKGFGTRVAYSQREALQFFQKRQPDMAIMDMNFTIDTSGKQGLKLLKKILEIAPGLPVILITGWGNLQLAVDGMKTGAKDFMTKPWDNATMLNSVKTLLDLNQPQESSEKSLGGFEHIIGKNKDFLAVCQLAHRVSKTDASVLILGESGTGKELLAEAIHFESLRANKPFVKVNLGGISASLFESEMFGHKRGAFTGAVADRVGRFALADGGTIFLDEIGDLQMASQVKLLRVLQEKTFEVLGSSKSTKVDLRVISATNKSLEDMVAQGSFREDLFYRINLISLKLPALRERKSDIPLLVNFYLNNLKEIYQRPNLQVSDGALDWLSEQRFPGNIRQLKNLVERAVLVSPHDILEQSDFAMHYREKAKSPEKLNLPEVGEISLEEMEKMMVLKAMDHHQQNISKAARSLGLTRAALYRRLTKYGIE